MPLMEGALTVLENALEIIFAWWWLILLPVFVLTLGDVIKHNKKQKGIKGIEWTLLQLSIPQDVVKTPLAMEQIFSGLHAILTEKSVKEWFSFEIRSVAGNIFFYLRTPNKFRNLAESHIYAQYPDAEIRKVDDYVEDFAKTIPNENYDLDGGEFELAREDPYPIRTWLDFKFETRDGEGDVDPLAGLVESLSKLKDGEQFWLQIVIRPVGEEWKKEGEDIVAKLIGRDIKDDKKKSVLLQILRKEASDYVKGGLRAPFELPAFDTEEGDDKSKSSSVSLSPGERDVIEAIEKNIAKVGFDVNIRGVYIAHKDVFDEAGFLTLTSAFRQFNTQNLNAIKLREGTSLKTKGIFSQNKKHYKKKELLANYYARYKSDKSFIFSTEELATFFHFPGRIVTSPTIQRIETKKGEPPIGLPMY